MKNLGTTFIPAASWLRQLGFETRAFEVLSIVEEKRSQRDVGWDCIVTIAVAPDGRPFQLFVQTRSQLTPQLAIAAFQKLSLVPSNGIRLLCAPYISPRVAELCRNENVGYLDGAGNCWLAGPGFFINISGRANPRPRSDSTIDPFSKKSSRIVRALLTNPNKGWQLQQLARTADVSLGLASKVKHALLEEAFLEERQRLLYVRDPAKLLNAWADQYHPDIKPLHLFAMTRPQETERNLGNWCQSKKIAYAVTQLAAAWRYSPMVRYERSVVYVDRRVELQVSIEEFLRQINAREVDTGANCTLWLTDDSSVFSGSTEIDGLNMVSPLQLYLDLKQLPGRGAEAAEAIAENELQEIFTCVADERKQPGGEPT